MELVSVDICFKIFTWLLYTSGKCHYYLTLVKYIIMMSYVAVVLRGVCEQEGILGKFIEMP